MMKKLSLCMIGPCTTQMDLMKTKMSTLTTMIEWRVGARINFMQFNKATNINNKTFLN